MHQPENRARAVSVPATIAGMFLWGSALAQQALSSYADASAQDASSSEVEEVVVTARKRAERDIDVPISVQAFSAATLDKNMTSNVDNLYASVPNLYFSSNLLSPGRDFINLVVRGVGAQSAGQPAVATIVDGVYQPSLAFDTGFIDVGSVEVLKGPQGTIFGRNTEGGALNIVTRRPDEVERGKFAVTADQFATLHLQGQVSGGLGHGFFGSFAVDASHTDGYLTNPTLGGDSADQSREFAGRQVLRYHPDATLDINLSVDESDTKGLDGLPGVPRGRHNYEVLSNFQIDARYKSIGGSLSVDYNFDGLKFTSLTGVRNLNSATPYDFSGGPVDGTVYPNELMNLQIHQNLLSQEFRLAGNSFGNTLHWLSGVYLFRDENVLLRRLDLAYLPAFGTSYTSNRQDQHLVDKGFAIFADGVYDLTRDLSIDVGVRYGSEKTTSNFFHDAVIPNIFFADSGGSGSVSSNNVTPSASLLYRLTPDSTVYFRYAKGERAGGFPLAPTVSTNIAFKPEKTDNFEIGSKARLWNGLFGYDFSAFFIKIKDQQVTSVAFLNGDPTLPVATTTNAGESSSRGVEGTFTLNPSEALALTANFGYVDAHYDRYIDTVGANRAGEAFPFVPRFTTAESAEYSIPLSGDRKLVLYGEYQHVGQILSGSGVDIDLQFHVKAYDLVNARASLFVNPQLKLDVFVNNLFDKYIETKVFNTFFFGDPRPFSTVLPPRDVGARVSYSF
jgi:iron complex outermembrane recepter protein